jgi:hypothetical protein
VDNFVAMKTSGIDLSNARVDLFEVKEAGTVRLIQLSYRSAQIPASA